MAESLIEIKRKISSTKKTSQITSAMQMVSGSKLNKSETASRNFEKYSRKVRETVTHLAVNQLKFIEGEQEEDLFEDVNPDNYHKMLISRPIQRTGYIVITTDKGLAGGYNSSVIKQTLNIVNEDLENENDCVIIAIGRAGADFFKSRGLNVAYQFRGLSDHPTFDEVRKIVKVTINMYENKIFDELYVCYNHHINSLASQYRAEKMLPISDLDPGEVKTYELDYILEPSQEAILDALLPQYAEGLIYGAILDAKTAEHAARMSAMKSATDNAKNIIDDLTISYNRARQAMITQEITEIVGGAAALE